MTSTLRTVRDARLEHYAAEAREEQRDQIRSAAAALRTARFEARRNRRLAAEARKLGLIETARHYTDLARQYEAQATVEAR